MRFLFKTKSYFLVFLSLLTSILYFLLLGQKRKIKKLEKKNSILNFNLKKEEIKNETHNMDYDDFVDFINK